jgi:hypothetical protein
MAGRLHRSPQRAVCLDDREHIGKRGPREGDIGWHALQRRIDLVSHAGREPTHGLEFLRRGELARQAPHLGHIEQQSAR